ncbi:hypothetical protein [Nitratifractor sp.]|uniref:hypothetical protein n=1 Tax=Nitratifractor sp. TaxID=2268144 RepID=UPI0025D513B4|nr:hypothetical protein [Nitratifractor sp.]
MQITIDVKSDAVNRFFEILEEMKEDVTIISHSSESDLEIETIREDDPDYGYIIETRKRREMGEKTYSIDEVMKEFEYRYSY